MRLKDIIPQPIRLQYKLIKVKLKDQKQSIKFATKKNISIDFPFVIKETQTIKHSNYYENKIENLQLGASLIEPILINQGEVFSFWKAIGNPSFKRGFKEGRNIIEGKLVTDYGGGLCQLSSIIYLISLKTGLEIIERHNHTVDIYEEEQRFTPLGADATVVYGYKDLRIRNSYPFTIKFDFQIKDNLLYCLLSSQEELTYNNLEFIRKYKDNKVSVETQKNGKTAAYSEYLLN
jgi:vancomycin resistance protein VanW